MYAFPFNSGYDQIPMSFSLYLCFESYIDNTVESKLSLPNSIPNFHIENTIVNTRLIKQVVHVPASFRP